MIVILAIAAMIAVDQLVKFWAVQVLRPRQALVIWENVFELRYVENRGAAFSILQDQRWLFVVGTVVAVAIMIYLLRKGVIVHTSGRVALYLIIGGAIGNWIDRLFRGYVVDLFYFKLINFPVFNVADIFLTIGGVLLFAYVLFGGKGKKTP